MSNKSIKNAPLYGVSYQKLQTALFKQRQYGEMRLSSYLSTRMGVADWTFSPADIAKQTGLNRHKTYELCELLVQAGIFTLKEEIQGGTSIYQFDQAALSNYLQGETSLTELVMGASVKENEPGCSAITPGMSPTTLPGRSSTTTWHLSDQLPGPSPTTPWLVTNHPPGRSPATINKMNNEDEKKDQEYILTNRAYVSISQSPDADQTQSEAGEKDLRKETERNAASKAQEFITRAKSIQASNSELGIIITSKAHYKLVDLFTNEPDMTSKELGDQWENAITHASYCKFIVSLNDPLNNNGTKTERGEYDELFWLKRSCDLMFFLNNRANVVACLPEFKSA